MKLVQERLGLGSNTISLRHPGGIEVLPTALLKRKGLFLHLPPRQPIYGQIPYFNEDFIYYQQKVPGVMFLLGGSNSKKGLISMPHSPDFAVDEETIKFGVRCFSSLLLERTNSGKH